MSDNTTLLLTAKRPKTVDVKTTVEWVKPRVSSRSSGTGRSQSEETDDDRTDHLVPRSKYAFEREKFSGNS